METAFYFRLEKEANMASDENNNPSEAFVKIKLGHNKPIESDEQYKDLQGSMKTMISGQLNIEESYISPITEDEYSQNTDEDLEDNDEDQTTCDDCGETISEEEYQYNNGYCNECSANHYEGE